MNILVINTGSSSIKFRIYNMPAENCLAQGSVENIGESESRLQLVTYHDGLATVSHESSSIADHTTGLEWLFGFLHQADVIDCQQQLHAIGHRVVHGGETFQAPVRIDEQVILQIKACVPLAPLHNPANLAGIYAAARLCPGVPQVAVFDTAFFQQLPATAYRYALPDSWYSRFGIRRYGFHGTSHQFVVNQAADYLQLPLNKLRLISLHLGNGASIAAVQNGVCIDTSMGMTPLEGLMMGTRSGDIDPGIIFYLVREHGLSLDTIEDLLNQESGLKGVCGANNMREIHLRAGLGDERAKLALAMFIYRLQKYIGAYSVALGGLDGLIFTAGIGEHDARLREAVCNGLSSLSISLNPEKNQQQNNEPLLINDDQSKVRVLVVPTNEELAIARDTVSIVGASVTDTSTT